MLHVITPSRGRPHNALRLRDALRDTCAGQFRLLLGIDEDDMSLRQYGELEAPDTHVIVDQPNRLTAWCNRLTAGMDMEWVAFLGDDHVPRTPGWDKTLIGAVEALPGPGWAYGDDLLMGDKMPTAWLQHGQLLSALGWMMLPACEHLCLDIAVLELGKATDRIAYVCDVVVEHMHPANGKAEFDPTYAAANSAEQVGRDSERYYEWLRGPQFTADVSAVLATGWTVEHG